MRTRPSVFAIALSLALAAPVVAAPVAGAVTPSEVHYTSSQLEDNNFMKMKPGKKYDITESGYTNMMITANTAAPFETVTLTGKAPKYTKPGTVLTLYRYHPTDKKGSGEMIALPATTTVNKDGTFSLRMQLGMPGVYGYQIGYTDGGDSPEMIGFIFQLRTT